MIVHPDGRIEGTPEEITTYMRLKNSAINTFLPQAGKQQTSGATTTAPSQARYDANTAGGVVGITGVIS